MSGWDRGSEPDAAGRRRAVLPDGTVLTVRPMAAADAPGLRLLYQGLSIDDRYCRFFSAYRPTDRFITQLARIAERGGYGLVAVAGPAPGPVGGAGRIVADASYVLLPDGDGEFAITVAREWRGWLGPWLLDALVEAAAARGVPNLRADILRENRPMLALVRARGFAAVEHVNYQVVRVVIGTQGRMPGWPAGHDRPRVLVELPGAHWHAEEAARAAGLRVMACPGPERGAGARCPVPDGAPCPLAAGADVIVCGLVPAQERSRTVMGAHRRLHPEVPVCGQIVGSALTADYDDFGFDAVLPAGTGPDEVVRTVQRLVGDRAGRLAPAGEARR